MTEDVLNTNPKAVGLDTKPKIIVGSPNDLFGGARVSAPLDNVQVVDQKSMLNWEIGKDPMPEIKVTHTPEDELLQVLTPVYQKAEEQLLKLRGVPGSEDLYDRYKRVVDYSYTWRAYAEQQRRIDEETKQREAEAQQRILEAEALLDSTSDESDVEAAYEKVKAIVAKLGSRVSVQLQAKLAELNNKMRTVAPKEETK